MSRRYGLGRSRRFGPGREYLRLDPHGLDPTPHGETRSPGTTTHYTPGKPPTTVSNTSPGRHPSVIRTEPGGQETASYVPGPKSKPRAPRYSGSNPIAYLADLITPGPTAHETAEAAQRLGVKPQQAAPEAVGKATSGLLHTISQGVNNLSQDAAKVVTAPKQPVHSFLGRRTLGTPTANQLLQAAHKGTERVNRKGRLTIPATRHAARNLQHARQTVARSTGVEGPLTPGQKVFVQHYAKLTGLDPRVVAAQALAEESGSAATQREAEGNHNWLNIGYFDSGPGAITKQAAWSNPVSAAKAAAAFTKGQWGGASPGIQHILASAGSSPQQQINAIGNSGWATSAYGDALRRTFPEVSLKSNPKALAALAAAKQQAQKLGIPTKSAGGDIEHAPGAAHTVFVRADAKGFVQWAKALLGTQEGSRLQLKWANEAGISAAEPWCAAFVTAGILRRGMTPPPGSANSQSWMTWKEGTNIGTDVRKAKPGDIIVIGQGDHIGLYVGGGKMIAGNWSNEVSEYAVAEDTRGVEGIIRPHFKGGKVAVQESAVLPGAAIGPAGEIVSGPAGVGAVGGTTAAGTPQQQRGGSYAGVSLRPLNPLISTAGELLTPGEQAAAATEEGEPEDIIQSILRRKRL